MWQEPRYGLAKEAAWIGCSRKLPVARRHLVGERHFSDLRLRIAIRYATSQQTNIGRGIDRGNGFRGKAGIVRLSRRSWY